MAGVTPCDRQHGSCGTVELAGERASASTARGPVAPLAGNTTGVVPSDMESWGGPMTGRIPLRDLPSLPPRAQGWYAEPFCGICVVTVFCLMFIGIAHGARSSEKGDSAAAKDEGWLATIPLYLVWAEALVATLCVMYLLLGGAGTIRRSEMTCFP
eukprot:351190_1